MMKKSFNKIFLITDGFERKHEMTEESFWSESQNQCMVQMERILWNGSITKEIMKENCSRIFWRYTVYETTLLRGWQKVQGVGVLYQQETQEILKSKDCIAVNERGG